MFCGSPFLKKPRNRAPCRILPGGSGRTPAAAAGRAGLRRGEAAASANALQWAGEAGRAPELLDVWAAEKRVPMLF